MLRARCFPAFSTVAVAAALLGAPAHTAAATEYAGALAEVPLPGGLRAALAVIDDRVVPDRGQFLLEIIRRTYQTSAAAKIEEPTESLRALLVHLDRAAADAVSFGPAETIPLPLTPAIWIDVVLGGRSSPKTLVADILRSRATSLLYYGLLSLDDATRAWIATKPDLIKEIATQHYGGFVAAAPALRVAGETVRVPGGDLAQPAWEALVGVSATEPVRFVRALVTDRERLAYFFGAMAQLTDARAAYVFNLHASDTAVRVATLRRLHAVFERLAPGWRLDDRTFWRPAADPALLLSELAADAAGRPLVPGTRWFWSLVFEDDAKPPRSDDARALAEGEPIEFAWLCEQIFGGDHRRRYAAVLFGSRVVRQVTAGTALDAVEAVRAVGRYPALVAALERAGIDDVSVFAAASRAAARLAAIDDNRRAQRALAQFQGALALVTRAARRGGVPAEALPGLVSSLAAVELSARGEYEGRLVRWLEALLGDVPPIEDREGEGAGPVERDVIRVLAGAPASAPPLVDWEGTRYRVDVRRAEALRLARLVGADARPYLSSARALVDAADALTAAGLSRDGLTTQVAVLRGVAEAIGGDAATALQRLARDVDVRSAGRAAAAVRLVADALLARGLIEFAYAAALGHPDRAAITAGDAASRHDFGLGLGAIRRLAPWRFPAAGTAVDREWRVMGSLLGLDVKLAEFSLVAVSAKPPLRRPSVRDEDRRVFIEAVALVEPAALTDADRETMLAAIRTGRARLAAVRSAADAGALADAVRLGPARRSLFAWTAAHAPDALPRFLSYAELLSLGLAEAPVTATMHAWGAPAEPRVGCLCLQLFDRRSLESVEGRWNSGILASAFPDLHLRVAELLAELRMPANLLPAVLAPAMLDFVNTADCRDHDDRRGLLDFVQRLRPDRVELYLALLTSDGPLVPLTEGSSDIQR